MPNRVIRDWTDSEKIDAISFQAEVLLLRLMMKADDFGSYHANPKLINAFCFPLKSIRDTDIIRWLQELASADLIVLYNADNKPYLNILNFGQRLRSMKKSFPQISDNQTVNKNVSELSASCQRVVTPETEVETDTEVEKKESVVVPTQTSKIKSFKVFTKDDFKNSIAENAKGFEKEMLNKFYQYWTEPSPSGKMRFQLEKTWETARRLNNWRSREKGILPAESSTMIKRKRL